MIWSVGHWAMPKNGEVLQIFGNCVQVYSKLVSWTVCVGHWAMPKDGLIGCFVQAY